jgi:hypothetical protein
MADYRVYIIGADGHFRSAIPLVCENDDDAIERAKQLVDGHDLELWQLGRKVVGISHKSGSS